MSSGGDKSKRKEHKPGRRPVIGGDLRIGLIVTLGLGALAIPRALSGVKKEQAAATTPAASQAPVESTVATEHAIATEPAKSDPPKLDPAAAPALTDVMPKGYREPSQAFVAPVVLPKSEPTKTEPPKPEPPKMEPAKPLFANSEPPKSANAPSPPKPLFPTDDLDGPGPQSKPLDVNPKSLKEPPAAPNVAKATPAVGSKPVNPYFERFLERKEYFVREGDTLDDIARRLYGDASKASEILAANGDKLHQPGDVRSGMLLKLP